MFFFFKQKPAYEITYGDWSSDVCSSDLCQFGAIVSDSHIWDWSVYLALNILIVLYVYLRPGEARTKSSQQKLLIAVLIHTAVIISTLWRAYRVSFIMDIFFDILDFWAILGFILILKFGLSKR